MEKEPYISVVVPMYKVERYIKVCIDSVLIQTFQDFEIIIVDDASPDNCNEICQNLYGNNKKIKIVRHKKNAGLGPARNTGIKNAAGKWIVFLDSDDALLPFALEKIYEVTNQTEADIIQVAGWYETTQDDSDPIDIDKLKLRFMSYNTQGFLTENILARLDDYWQKNQLASMAWLRVCRRKFLKDKNLKFEATISEDEFFSFKALCWTKKYFVLREAFYIYRRRVGSIMGAYNPERFAKAVEAAVFAPKYCRSVIADVPEINKIGKVYTSSVFKFFDIFYNSHFIHFYNDAENLAELYKSSFAVFQANFKENAQFADYFFNMFNVLKSQIEQVLKQNQILQQQVNLLMTFDAEKPNMLKIIEELKTAEKRFLFMSTPRHGNLGDQAIVMGERYIMENCFPDHKIIEIPYSYLTGELGKLFSGLGYAKYIHPSDDIVLHGGGNLGNIWLNEEIVRRDIIEKFPNNRIVSFPQSIHFTEDAQGQRQAEESANIYNAHQDLHLMLRDENSFNVANKLFPNVKTYLVPDIVTALFGTLDNLDFKREGILFVLRHDKEKVRNDALIQAIQNFLAQKNIPFDITDTVINEYVSQEERSKKVTDCLLKFKKSRVVVTDRFHGVIFSVITKTPVMAFKSYDTKISSGIKWFKDFPSVFYAENSNLREMLRFVMSAYLGEFENSFATTPPLYFIQMQSNFVENIFKDNNSAQTRGGVIKSIQIN